VRRIDARSTLIRPLLYTARPRYKLSGVQPGQRLADRYDIARTLGAGGMGHVFLARDVQLERDVAVKVLPPDLLTDPIARERMRREAKSAAALDHPFVCKVFEVGESQGQLFIVMELVVGETLHERLSRGPVPIDEVIDMAGEIAEALEAAHDLRLVHRDLKPANVMTTTRGHLKVMDFGLAKTMGSESTAETKLDETPGGPLTGRSARVGTPAYMSPEQIAGDVVDHRSDIFSFGVLITELVTGLHPFNRPTLAATVAAVLADPPIVGHAKAPEVPSALRAVLHRMMAKLPHERYPSMREVRNDLNGLRTAKSSTGGLLGSAVSVGHRGRAQRWPMVGRDAERAELMLRLEDAIAGRGSLVLIGGEPGIGKTRLTEELLAEAKRRGGFCLVGHCYEGEGAPPYVPFVEITEHTARTVPPAALRSVLGDSAPEVAKLMPELRRMFNDIPPALELPPEQQRRFFFNAYRDFVERASRANPIAVVFEDLHWADEPTLQLLLHLAQTMSSLPLLVIGTYRDVELEVTRPFAKILETLLRQRLATRMTLRRLPADGVAELLSAMSGKPAPASLARAIFKETEGNPFFVEEVFQHLAEEGKLFDDSGAWRQDLRVESLEVPEGVRLVIGRRLEKLSDATRRILITAAVIGRAFSLALLESLEQDAGDAVLEAVEAAEQAHLLSPQSGTRESRYVFAHELIRQTLVESLSLPRRQRLHGRIAAAIERVYATSLDAHVSALAHHLYQAGAASDPEKTSGYLARAAEQARASAAHEDALIHLDHALSLWEGESSTHVAQLTERRALTLRSLGRLPAALDAFGASLRHWEHHHEHDRAAAIVAELSTTRLWMMDTATGDAEVSRGLTRLSSMSADARALLHYSRAVNRFSGGNLAGALEDFKDGDRLRVPGVNSRLDSVALIARANFEYAQLQPERSLDLAQEAAAACRARGDVWGEANIVWTIPLNLFFLGRAHEAVHALDELQQITERIGHQGARWVIHGSRAFILVAAGDVGGGLKAAQEALDIARAAGIPWAYHTESFLGSMAIRMGREEEGIAVLRRVAEFEPENTYWHPVMRALLFNALAKVAPDDARASHQTSKIVPRITGNVGGAGSWASIGLLIEAYARLGLRDEIFALEPYLAELKSRGVVQAGGWVPPVTVLSGIVNTARGEWEQADNAFRRGLELMGANYLQSGPSREWYAEMFFARARPGDRERGLALLDEAIETYKSLGLAGLEKHARRRAQEI
jgi:tetratricopeptide (TPR) repeat protein